MTYTCTCIYKRAQISDSTETCKIGNQDIVILCNLNIFIFFILRIYMQNFAMPFHDTKNARPSIEIAQSQIMSTNKQRLSTISLIFEKRGKKLT